MSNRRGSRRQRSGRGAREPSQRQLRAAELVRHVLAEIFTHEEIHHKELTDVAITVTEVAISSDLRQANCYIIPLGGRNAVNILAALRKISPWIGGQVARRIRLKFAPQLNFHIDDSFDNAKNIQQLLLRHEVAPKKIKSKGCDDGA